MSRAASAIKVRHAALSALLSLLLALAGCGIAAAGAGASSARSPRCHKLTVAGKRWGVYVERGPVSCTNAAKVIAGVLAGRGRSVDAGPADTYIVYHGWVCPYYQMGVVDCQRGPKPVAHPSRVIFALACSTAIGEPGCPVRGEA